ncbi:MAG: FAD-binding protein [Anaerolineales bacterium]|nr:FAD-binding protein [Anaerolineales bacterium]
MTATLDLLIVDSIAGVQEAVAEGGRLLPRGGGTKPATGAPPGAAAMLDLKRLTGILEYEPGEYVFTALAGTPLAEIQAELATHGQYLPFDPPLVEAGATLGGTIAAGLSGSGRQRYGGLRDFLIGARFVDGQGRLVRSGGKVVKNAAGFDLHKLLIGSLGRLAVLVEASFKVFPQPPAYATLRLQPASIEAALALMARLGAAKFDLEAIDIVANDAGNPHLLLRLGGLETTLLARMNAMSEWIGRGEILRGDEEARLWRETREFGWLPNHWQLAKAPVTPEQIPALERWLAARGAATRYISAGNLAWIGWPGGWEELSEGLRTLRLGAVTIVGTPGSLWLGTPGNMAMIARMKQALDPAGHFLDFAA